MTDGKICLCRNCIDAIKSRGEPVYVGEAYCDDEDENGNPLKCEWCEENDVELFDCMFP